MSDETASMLKDTYELAKKCVKWLKRNSNGQKEIDLGMMLKTSMALGSVSKMIYHSALAMSEEQTERMMS